MSTEISCQGPFKQGDKKLFPTFYPPANAVLSQLYSQNYAQDA
jgi:hypothetical protein